MVLLLKKKLLIQIDNKHNATLNYKYIAPVNDRPVFDVVKELMSKVR